jgi:bacteriocin-like protein
MKKADKTKKGQKTRERAARVTEVTEQELKQVQGGRAPVRIHIDQTDE